MEKKRAYFAAGLFNLADKYFNASLSAELEENFDVVLPQRQGFEFSRLHTALEGIVSENEIENAINHIIYYLDLGFLLHSCDFCFARLDEPADEGVIVEVKEAKRIHMPVIGYRTDIRSPYGSDKNEVRGAHFFPAYSCDMLINFTSGKISEVEEGKKEIKRLAELIYLGAERILNNYNGKLPHKDVNITSGIHYIGKTLFRDLEDLHSEESLTEIARRYVSLKKACGNLCPAEIVMA